MKHSNTISVAHTQIRVTIVHTGVQNISKIKNPTWFSLFLFRKETDLFGVDVRTIRQHALISVLQVHFADILRVEFIFEENAEIIVVQFKGKLVAIGLCWKNLIDL